MIRSSLSAIAIGVFFCGVCQSTANATGTDVGNGGGAIVCRDQSGEIQQAWLSDLWEGAHLPWRENKMRPLRIQYDDTRSEEEQIQSAMEKIRRVNALVFRKVRAALSDVNAAFLVGDFQPRLVDDFTSLATPEVPGLSCRREQLALYTRNNGILVNRAIWNALRPTDRAATRLHEAIYKVERESSLIQADNSDHTRKVVGFLFSDMHMNRGILGHEFCKRFQVKVTSERSVDQRYYIMVSKLPGGEPFLQDYAPDVIDRHEEITVCGLPNSVQQLLVVAVRAVRVSRLGGLGLEVIDLETSENVDVQIISTEGQRQREGRDLELQIVLGRFDFGV